MLKINDPNLLKRTIKIYIIAALIFLITFILALIFSPSVETFKNIDHNSLTSIKKAEGLNKVWQFIINNGFKVPLQMFITALIPIPFLYFAQLMITSILSGILYGLAVHWDFHKGLIMILASIPHSIIEIAAMSFMISGLYKVNTSIIRKISNVFRKNKKQNYSLKLALLNLLKIYLFCSLPLIIIAAFLETYLTDYIYNLFT